MNAETKQQAQVFPAFLQGQVTPPVSKSLAHRRLFCRYLACFGQSSRQNEAAFYESVAAFRAKPELASEDILASCDVLEGLLKGESELNCRESGSTLRFAIPLAGLSQTEHVFNGHGRLPKRPLKEYKDVLEAKGMQLDFADEDYGVYLPLSVTGRLLPGHFSLPGNVSSQYFTGLILALPLLEEDSVISLMSPLESVSYVELTLAEQKLFGVEVHFDEAQGDYGAYVIKGGQNYVAPAFLPAVEADDSQAAFFHLANYLGADLDVRGLNPASKQGDAIFRHFLGDFAAMQNRPNATYLVQECDLSQYPDIVPALSLAAAVTQGTHIFKNLARLRMKECDRLSATVEMLMELGVEVEEGADFILIKGMKKPLGGYLTLESGERLPLWFKDGRPKTYDDHRMMMCICIAACHTAGGLRVDNLDCVKKSYPHFVDEFMRLGGRVERKA